MEYLFFGMFLLAVASIPLALLWVGWRIQSAGADIERSLFELKKSVDRIAEQGKGDE